MSDSTNKTISIRIAIDIPVDIADSTLQKLQGFVSQVTSLQTHSNASRINYLDSDEIAQGIKHAGQKAYAEMQAEKEQNQVDTERRDQETAKYAANLRDFERKAVQSYRLFRQLRPNFERDYDTYKAIAERFYWPTPIVKTKVTARKRQIKAYLKERRSKTIMRLAYLGWTNKRIAAHIGLHEKTVAAIFLKLRKGFRV